MFFIFCMINIFFGLSLFGMNKYDDRDDRQKDAALMQSENIKRLELSLLTAKNNTERSLQEAFHMIDKINFKLAKLNSNGYSINTSEYEKICNFIKAKKSELNSDFTDAYYDKALKLDVYSSGDAVLGNGYLYRSFLIDHTSYLKWKVDRKILLCKVKLQELYATLS